MNDSEKILATIKEFHRKRIKKLEEKLMEFMQKQFSINLKKLNPWLLDEKEVCYQIQNFHDVSNLVAAGENLGFRIRIQGNYMNISVKHCSWPTAAQDFLRRYRYAFEDTQIAQRELAQKLYNNLVTRVLENKGILVSHDMSTWHIIVQNFIMPINTDYFKKAFCSFMKSEGFINIKISDNSCCFDIFEKSEHECIVI